ncbi:MAG: tetratricopeptide repeat protein [Bacteroidota bacterium]
MSEEEHHKIELYLKGKLLGSQLEEFEHRMQLDTQFRSEVELFGLAINAVKSDGLKSDLEAIHKELYEKDEKVIGISGRRWFYVSGIAASILIFVAVRFFIFNNPNSSEQLFETYFSPFPDYVTKRNPGDLMEWEKGFQAYSEGNYQLAIYYFTEENNPKNLEEDILFYLGMSYLANEKNSEAIVTFSELLQQSTKYRQQLHWYLSLAYLKSGQINEAISILEKIERKEYQNEEARELLELLSDQKENGIGSNSTKTTP